jgi:hypothetical protein
MNVVDYFSSFNARYGGQLCRDQTKYVANLKVNGTFCEAYFWKF